MFTPTQLNPTPKHRKGDDFAYSFQFVEDASPLNLTNFDDVQVRLYNNNNTVFEQSTLENTATISGVDNDIISGVVGGEAMNVGTRSYFIDIVTFLDGKKRTYVSSPFLIVGEGTSGTANEWIITITNSTDSATGERATNIMALAVQFKNEATEQAGIATTKAGEAQTSATNASNSETNASTSASNASTSEQNALTQANRSETEANRAEANANEIDGLIVDLGLTTQGHYDYVTAIKADGGEIINGIKTKQLFEV